MSAPTGPDPAMAAIAGLGRSVEALERRIETLSALTALPERVDELAALLARLAEHAATAAPVVEPRPATSSWLNHPTEPGDAQRDGATVRDAESLLSELAEWVTRVYLHYSDTNRGLPECWLWHPDVVEELLWLRTAWLAAYRPDAPVLAVGDWHDRQRPWVVRRIRDHCGHCRLESHDRDGTRQTRAAPNPVSQGMIAAIAGWWVTSRDQPAPMPSDLHILPVADTQIGD